MKKLVTVIIALCLSVTSMSGVSVYAAYENDTVNEADTSSIVTATFLIYSKELSVSNSSGKLCINGKTICMDTMNTVGFTDIVVERSSNGSSGWTTAYTLNDVLSSNANSCYIDNMSVTVTGGYYYRVSCNHYAKETGWFFPQSQSVANTSNAVYIS